MAERSVSIKLYKKFEYLSYWFRYQATYLEMKYHLKQILKGKNESYIKGLEYLSSMVILSRCKGLIGGNCGGSKLALMLSNLDYEYWHLWDLGLYPSNKKTQ